MQQGVGRNEGYSSGTIPCEMSGSGIAIEILIGIEAAPLPVKLCLQYSWPNQPDFNIYDKASIKEFFC